MDYGHESQLEESKTTELMKLVPGDMLAGSGVRVIRRRMRCDTKSSSAVCLVAWHFEEADSIAYFQ